MGIAYDAARGEVVLFGGSHKAGYLGDTWTWDGTTWTQQFPATAPSARASMGMTYDAPRNEVVLFGGGNYLGDTWDGTTWTPQQPPSSPSGRVDTGVTYDAARTEVVLFGGYSFLGTVGDTWAWAGTNWRVPFVAELHLSPNSGPPLTYVQVMGTGFAGIEKVTLTFIDSGAGRIGLGTFTSDGTGTLIAQIQVPGRATVGMQRIKAVGDVSRQKAKATFTVT
jgi:hypothetical protein